MLFKSTDYGMSWKVISPDLTTNDPEQAASRPAARSSSTTPRPSFTARSHDRAVAARLQRVWVGTDDGNVQVTRDGGKTWTQRLQQRARAQAERLDPQHRRVALRRRHRVCRRRSPPGRRLRAVHLHDHRLRQDVEADQRRPAGAARPGCTSFARIRRTATCSTSAPRWASGHRGITARTGIAARRAAP